MTEVEATANGITAGYEETDTERRVVFSADGRTAARPASANMSLPVRSECSPNGVSPTPATRGAVIGNP